MKEKTGPRWGTRDLSFTLENCAGKRLAGKGKKKKCSEGRVAMGTPGTSSPLCFGETTSGHFCAMSAVSATSTIMCRARCAL